MLCVRGEQKAKQGAMENMGIADLKENPLEEEANRMEQDLSEKVDKELPPLEAKARVSLVLRAFFSPFFFGAPMPPSPGSV